ncbi:MAG TPA: GDSL-type esterase/lipase family protein, partial [Pyrinomonadaceae bacterium]|nr:GDSL-type esterase/lipase family protein [Pyrinomonadaceae bacterium]
AAYGDVPVLEDDAPATAHEQEENKPAGPRHILLSKPARTILFVLIFASLPLFVPRLARFREMLPNPRELVSFMGSEAPSSKGDIPGGAPSTSADAAFAATAAPTPVIVGADHPVEDPTGALNSFYNSLSRTDARAPGAITRITHYGDSPITNDGITSTVRRLLQTRFGDAGHGFILMDRPWAWYGHDAISFTPGNGWSADAMMNAKASDGEFGLGGVTFRATGPGTYTRFAPASQGETGKNFSRMDVYYLQQPGGGQFSVEVNDGDSRVVSTGGEDARSGFFEVKAPASGPNSFDVKTLSGEVRLFGAVLENDGPGVVYDSLGVNGAYAGLLVSAMNQAHWYEQLQHRKPNMVIINYGTNESQYATPEQLQRYDRDLREVVRRVREALPGISILIVSPMDRGQMAPGGKIITKPSIPMIVDLQRRVALETNCAFFNAYAAMGGEGTMAKWAAAPKRLVRSDLTHPTAEGAEIVGRLIYEALYDGYAKYRARTGAQPLIAQGKGN